MFLWGKARRVSIFGEGKETRDRWAGLCLICVISLLLNLFHSAICRNTCNVCVLDHGYRAIICSNIVKGMEHKVEMESAFVKQVNHEAVFFLRILRRILFHCVQWPSKHRPVCPTVWPRGGGGETEGANCCSCHGRVSICIRFGTLLCIRSQVRLSPH